MPFFSIIIVSWNALHHLKNYLPSVVGTTYPHFEIILADNASTDGSKKWVKKHYPNVKIAELDKNYGYCGGNNRAVPYAKGDILLFLNNDVRVEPSWLDGLANCFQKYRDVAAAQPKMLWDSDPQYFEYAGAAGGFLDRFGYPFCRGRIFDTLEKDEEQYDFDSDILWASGAALAVRKEQFIEAGMFDEDFEFHMEEIDLCWHLWNLGYKVRYCPESTVHHLGGGSLPMDSPRKLYYNYRNNLRMIWKNGSPHSLSWQFIGRYLLDIAAAAKTLFEGDGDSCKAICRAHLDFWKGFHNTYQKRHKRLQQRTVTDNPATMLPKSIAVEYFLKGKQKFTEIFGV
ncbi:glycosyltransferase family 2 protein [Fodinibius sp. Rm-B-1B1-1]|uniref:glycosyltransferase family 2 protein n=1 Tax=Fodinibius alkaliphilus TaxID=3140241 RepID=UPI00315A3CF5